ncbi:MAG: PqqD family protein [Bacteroidales bacterium]|nr:PqqD family protein [Bacteroidales bacterium]
MKINPKFRLRSLAGENVIFMPGVVDKDTSKLMVLNETSAWLWNQLEGKDFDTEDVAKLLLSEYEVDETVALHDSEEWISLLASHHIFD